MNTEMSSNSSWPALAPTLTQLDFSPTAEDENNFDKCQAFWNFVRSRPELEELKAVPLELARSELDGEDSPDVTEKTAEADLGHYNLSKLKAINKTDIMRTAFRTSMPDCACTARKAPPTPPTSDVTKVYRQLAQWDQHHKCQHIPDAPTPNIHNELASFKTQAKTII